MQQKVLTIVVPSYNTSQYINKCISSFLDESILDDLEVLIIDDGSADNTYEIAKRFEEQYPNTVHAVRKENGGHGSVINVGIQMTSGKYMKVVDGDDWVLTENLCRLVNDLKEQDADMVLNPFHYVFAMTNKTKLVPMDSVYCGREQRFQDVCLHVAKHLKLTGISYRTELLRENHIRVREKAYYEDIEYNLFPTPYINTITIFDYPIYQYLVAQSSQSVSSSNLLKNQHMFYTIMQDCIEFYEKNQCMLAENVQRYIKKVVLDFIRSQYNIYLRGASDPNAFADLQRFNQDFRNNYGAYYAEIGKRDAYVAILQKENKPMFIVLSRVMKIYRKLFRW